MRCLGGRWISALGIAAPLGAEPRACARWDAWVRLSRAWWPLAAEPHRGFGAAVPGEPLAAELHRCWASFYLEQPRFGPRQNT